MENAKYPTDEASDLDGISINDFYNNGAATSILKEVDHLNYCESHAIMCCFGRDRQYRDGNGDCTPNDCDDADPGDNTNLCYEDHEGVFVCSPVKHPGNCRKSEPSFG